MGDPVHPGADLEVQAIEKPARELDMTLRWVPTRSTGAVRELLGTLEHSPPDALVVLPDAVMLENRERVRSSQSVTAPPSDLVFRLPLPA
jgi:hypothetical protein